MRKTRLVVVVAGALLSALSTARSQVGDGQKLRVGILDMTASALKMQTAQSGIAQPVPGMPSTVTTTTTIAIAPPAEFARGLTEMLGTVMLKTGRFTVLERAVMQQIEQEQALATGGKVTKETAAKVGAMLGAQALIVGDITGFAYNQSSIGGKVTNMIKGLNVSSTRVTAEVNIDLRLIDPSTTELIYSAKGSGKASATGVSADLTRDDKSWGGNTGTSTPLGQASRDALTEAVANLLKGMPKVAWTGRIIDVRGGVVYVNAASAEGMKKGLELNVFDAQAALVDPETGKSLGAPERMIGTIVIDSVLEKFSTAKIVKGDSLARGHLLRAKTP